MLTYLQMISRPDWPFENGPDSLQVIRHYEAQLPALADHLTVGMLTGFIHLLMYGNRWEEVGKYLLLLWSEFKRLKIAYIHFLRLASTNRTKLRTTASAGHAAATGRIKSQHYSRTFRDRFGSKYYDTWGNIRGTEDEGFFCTWAVRRQRSARRFEIVEGFAIAALELFESRLLF